MRVWLAIALSGLVAGCNGYVADYVGPREGIIKPQLLRYGLTGLESDCVATRLTNFLSPRQMRRLEERARGVERPFFSASALTARDLMYVAQAMEDQQVQLELVRALSRCEVRPEALAGRAGAADAAALSSSVSSSAPSAVTIVGPGQLPPPSGLAAPGGGGTVTAPANRRPAWLNLGAAGSGQAIAVDGASIEQEGTARTAWFRMIDPPPSRTPSQTAYRLRIDCTSRTISPLARRRYGADGAIAEEQTYVSGTVETSQVEGGTVTEIAFLSLCT